MTDLAFVDVESTGLNPDLHAVWEIAVIRRTPDGTETEHLWQRRLTDVELAEADPRALEINRYHERMVVPDGVYALDMLAPGGDPKRIGPCDLDAAVHAALDGAVMVGSNPPFDASFLRPMLGAEPWHYRTVDVATLAAGYLYAAGQIGSPDPELPFKSRELSRAMGVEPPGDDAHQALVDARWAASFWDAVTGQVAW